MHAGLEDLGRRYYDWLFEQYPAYATYVGAKGYDHLLPAPSLAKEEALWAKAEDVLRELDALDASAFDGDDRIDAAILRSNVLGYLQDRELRGYARKPDAYVDAAVNALYVLVQRNHDDLPSAVPALIERAKLVPAYLRAARELLESAPPVWIRIAEEGAAGAPSLVALLRAAVAARGPVPAELDTAFADVERAFAEYRSTLCTLPREPEEGFAVGTAMYERILRESYLFDVKAADMGEMGWAAVERTTARLEETARAIDPEKPWRRILEEARETFGIRREDLLDAYRDEVARLRAFVAEKRILTIPANETCDIVEAPPFFKATMPTAAYMGGAPLTERQRGEFYVNVPDADLPEDAGRKLLREHHGFALTAAHEAYPGHHLQLSRAHGAPSRIRKLGADSILLIEGWGLYCEELLFEIGYLDDPVLKLRMLSDELWRAYRIVVDHGMQTGAMTLEEGIDLYVEKLGFSRERAEGEFNWYTQRPVYPSCYYLGKKMLRDLRAAAKLPMLEFHDRLLALGSIPPSLARRAVLGED